MYNQTTSVDDCKRMIGTLHGLPGNHSTYTMCNLSEHANIYFNVLKLHDFMGCMGWGVSGWVVGLCKHMIKKYFAIHMMLM